MTKLELKRLLADAGFYYSQHRKYFYKSGNYTFRHGEYEQPEYYIRKVRGKDDYYIYAKYFFLPGTMGTPKSGPLSQDDMHYLHEDAQLRKVGESYDK